MERKTSDRNDNGVPQTRRVTHAREPYVLHEYMIGMYRYPETEEESF